MTREEEIEKLKNFLNFKVHEHGGWYRVEDIVDCVLRWADEHPKNQLIKFAYKKPQVGKRVIFQDDYFNDGEFYTAALCEDGKIELFGIYEDLKIKLKASACWMPMPETPKGGEV